MLVKQIGVKKEKINYYFMFRDNTTYPRVYYERNVSLGRKVTYSAVDVS